MDAMSDKKEIVDMAVGLRVQEQLSKTHSLATHRNLPYYQREMERRAGKEETERERLKKRMESAKRRRPSLMSLKERQKAHEKAVQEQLKLASGAINHVSEDRTVVSCHPSIHPSIHFCFYSICIGRHIFVVFLFCLFFLSSSLLSFCLVLFVLNFSLSRV